MELLLEFLAWILGELLPQILLELPFEWLHERVQRREPFGPVARALGYAAGGAALGSLSLWVLPYALLHAPLARFAWVAFAPLLSALLLVALRRGQQPLLQRFLEVWLFGLLFALVRAHWAD